MIQPRFRIALLAIGLAVWLGPTVQAQDMPLSMFLKPGESWRKDVDAVPAAETNDKPETVYTTRSPDGNTLYMTKPNDQYLWAWQLIDGSKAINSAPYCSLRLRHGQTGINVTGLTTDLAGRIYAATENGIQVFDPTGRLSGVISLPESGEPSELSWEGESRDELTVWVNGSKYRRRMATTGLP